MHTQKTQELIQYLISNTKGATSNLTTNGETEIRWTTISKFKIGTENIENDILVTLIIDSENTTLIINGVEIILTIFNYKFFDELLCNKALELATIDLRTEWVREEQIKNLWDGETTVEILEYYSPIITSPIKFVKGKYADYNDNHLISKHDVKRMGVFNCIAFIDKAIDLYDKYSSYLKREKEEEFTLEIIGKNYDYDNTADLDLLDLAIEYYVIKGEVFPIDWSKNLKEQEGNLLERLYIVKENFDNVQYEYPEEYKLIADAFFLYLYEKTKGEITCEYITTSARLTFEGRTMNHCVGGQMHQNKVKKQKVLIFSMSTPDYANKAYHYRATLEIEKKNEEFDIDEFFTNSNQKPSQEYRDLAKDFIKIVNRCDTKKDLEDLVDKYNFSPETRKNDKKQLNQVFTMSKVMEVKKK